MTIEDGLTQLQVDVAELTDESVKLAASVTSSLAEIDAVKGDIRETHNFVNSNYQAMNDWQTQHGTVTFKNLQGQNKEVSTLSKLILDSEKINPNPHVMSKAQFDALREIRKKQYAGSGFAEWGKHYPDSATTVDHINQGLFTDTARTNILVMGDSHRAAIGDSRSGSAISIVDGVEHNIKVHGEWSNSFEDRFNIQFPPAPDGTKTYDSATGVVTEHASAAEAFEGLVTNGDFRNGSTGWTLGPAWSIANGKATRTGGTTNSNIRQTFNVVAGVTYELSYFREHTGGSTITNVFADLREGSGIQTYAQANTTLPITVTDTFTPTSSGEVTFQIYGINNFEGSISNISVRPVTESVITSRKDLVFLETWHEAISDKDQVYPLGNVQYGATTYEGITLATRNDGYTRFGEWDTTTTGKYSTWSTLTETEKRAYINNPDNNIYYDSDADELIQVRYRVKVVEGLGDEWQGVRPTEDNGSDLRYSQNLWVKPRGARTSFLRDIDDDVGTSGDGYGVYTFPWRDWAGKLPPFEDRGIFVSNRSDVFSFDNQSTVLPIALVQRMNQGAYHPTYNPMGCARFDNGAGGSVDWYNGLAIDNDSTVGCFTGQKWGYIGSAGGSGRQDQYKFYDAIYAGQVEDLRLNANKLDVNQLREESMRKAVAGEMRGKGRVPFTKFRKLAPFGESGDDLASIYWESSLGNTVYVFYTSSAIRDLVADVGSDVYFNSTDKTTNIGVGTFERIEGGNAIKYIVDTTNWVRQLAADPQEGTIMVAEGLTPEFDSLPWVDIIGDPERIAATFPNGVVGQWIPQVPDGTTINWNLNRKQVTRHRRTRSSDDGASWVSYLWDSNSSDINNTSFHANGANDVTLLTYETPSNFTEPSNNSVVVGDVGDVWAGNDARVDFGNRLQGSLSDEVGTTIAYTTNRYAPIDGYTIWSNGSVLIPDEYPAHTSLPSLGGTDGNMGVKALSTITEKDGLLYLQLHGAQLQHHPLGAIHTINAGVAFNHAKGELAILQGFDSANFNVPVIFLRDYAATLNKTAFNGATIKADGSVILKNGTVDPQLRVVTSSTAWGDDQTIPIVDGENVKTDLNGNTVKVFCHHTQIPLGIARK